MKHPLLATRFEKPWLKRAHLDTTTVAQTSSLLYRRFPTCGRGKVRTACRLEVGDTAGLETCATSKAAGSAVAVARCARLKPVVACWVLCLAAPVALAAGLADPPRPAIARLLTQAGRTQGWAVVLGDPPGSLALELAQASEYRVYVQTPDAPQANAVRRAAEAAGLLGGRVFIQHGPLTRLHLADNLADVVVVRGEAVAAPRPELMRVLRPGGKLIGPDFETTKPFPAGIDDWSHPYHGPDNNPQSRDTVARAPYLTQFTAEPWYCPMPLVTVTAGGRLFKAFGHIAVKEREWPWLNSLVAQDAFNGTLLWKRPLDEGFMIHRNTMIATAETLYLADDHSCKLIAAATGEVRDEIIVPASGGEGPSWKWLALAEGTLYALVGPTEPPDPTVKGTRQARGWPWNGTALGRGYNSKTYPWGFGNTILALDPATKQVRWRHHEAEPLDARGLCLAAGRLFFYSQGKFLGALDTRTGQPLWKISDDEVLKAIGGDRFAQNPNEGFSSSSFVKANDRALYFAGPTRNHLVAVSATEGTLLWQAAGRGNSQLVLRDEGLFAMGTKESTIFDYLSGRVLRSLGARVNCTRATGSAESIFVRGGRDGTMRYDLKANTAQHIAPMRPSCQDGVLVAYGHLFWGPWMCDCNLMLVGVVSVAPAGEFDFNAPVKESERLERTGAEKPVAELVVEAADWPTLRANNQRNAFSTAQFPTAPKLLWNFKAPTSLPATAPIAAGSLVFAANSDGAVRALDVASGKLRWTAYTGGAITYPPALWAGRLYVGSGDGWLYALEAQTGRLLWRFRAAPAERLIPVYGALRSTWPVASGVLADNGLVYAAAGMANHDGTHVYALDATSGKLRWHNGTSGSLNPQTSAGVSVNGHLLQHEDCLYLAGGNMTPVASYALADGKCLTDPQAPPSHTQFRAGSDLFVAGDEVVSSGFPLYSSPGDYRVAGPVVLQTPAGKVVATPDPHDCKISLEDPAAASPESKPRWTQRVVSRLYGLAVTREALVVVGTHDPASADLPVTASVMALGTQDGRVLWQHPLPAIPVSWGLAIDRTGRTLVTLQDGQMLCYGER